MNLSFKRSALGILRNMTIESKDENYLWQLLLSGDKTALAELMDYYLDPLYNYAIRFSADRNLVEDCIQDLFVGIWQRRDYLSIPVNLKSYLFSSLRRMVLRKNRLARKIPVSSFTENESGEFDFQFSIEQSIIQQEESQIIAQKINNLVCALPKRQIEIIYLKFFENLSRDEIAEIIQISPQSVSNLLQKALKHLRFDYDVILQTIILLVSMGCLQFF